MSRNLVITEGDQERLCGWSSGGTETQAARHEEAEQ